MTEAIETIFEFVAENPPTAMIVGGILFVLISIATAPFDPETTTFLRELAIWLIIGGVLLQVLWLILRNR